VYCKNRSCGVYFLPVGLLQFAALRAAAHSTAQTAVCAECHCTTDHSPVLRELRWLPTRERVKVRQSLSGQAPLYLADDYRLGALYGQLTFRLAWCRELSSYGDRTFAAAEHRLWNSLPVKLRNPDITYGLFRRQLKGHLFREA